MHWVVMKFGGASVSNAERVRRVASIVAARAESVVVVVSARQGRTDDLIGEMAELTDRPSAETMDVLKSVGETHSAALVAAAISSLGRPARVVAPWRVIQTDEVFGDATVEEVHVEDLVGLQSRGVIPVLPGFIGATADGRLTTLGRGGSDYTAVAVGVALEALRVELHKAEVDGVYDADPNADAHARRFDTLTHEEALRLSRAGAKVLQEKAARLALRWRLPVVVCSTFGHGPGTRIASLEPSAAGLSTTLIPGRDVG